MRDFRVESSFKASKGTCLQLYLKNLCQRLKTLFTQSFSKKNRKFKLKKYILIFLKVQCNIMLKTLTFLADVFQKKWLVNNK